MKVVAGLGNPGARYARTRHNLGFDVVDEAAARWGAQFSKEKYSGLIAEARVGAESVWLVKPQTYMNKSGDCLAGVCRNRVQDFEQLLVVVDDVNLALGKLRLRAGGSAGGHNGLKSIMERLGSMTFHRLRLGVGAQHLDGERADFVLARFRPDEYDAVNEMRMRSVEAIECWLDRGMEHAMSAYNG